MSLYRKLPILIWTTLLLEVSSAGPPVIREHPSNGYAARLGPYTLRCSADGGGGAVPDISWYKDGERVHTSIDNPNSMYSLINGGNLLFLQFSSKDVGTYYCNATNNQGTTLSRNATLELAVLRDDFRQSPRDVNAVQGRTARLICQAPRGTPEPRVQWKKQGQRLNPDVDSRLSIEAPGNLVITDVVRSDEGQYVCVAINEAGERESQIAKLTVLEAPVIGRSPVDLIVKQGGNATFQCRATGEPRPRITWIKNGDLMDTSRMNVRQDGSLVIEGIVPSDEGSYTCVAENDGGRTEVVAHLTVNTPPIFLEKPLSKTVGKSTLVIFRCVVDGNPPPGLFWNKAQDGPSGLLLYSRQTQGRFSVLEDGSLRIMAVEVSDEGEYQCNAINSAGINVTAVSLRVRDIVDGRPPPVITEFPQNTTIALNQNAELQCKATGTPTPTIRWSHNGRPVLADSRITIDRGNLRVSEVTVTDSGEYTCLAISEFGEASAAAILNVIGVIYNTVRTLLPPAPNKPIANPQDITDTTIKLYWGGSGENSEGISYSVEYFTRQNKDGWLLGSRTQQTWALIENLLPGTLYVMLVRAHNRHGSSEASPLSEYVRTRGVTNGQGGQGSRVSAWSNSEIRDNLASVSIELNSADVLSSTTINVTWLVDIQKRKFVEGYYVRVSSQKGAPTEAVPSSLSSYHIVSNLQPYTVYRVTVTPFYLSFSGSQSNLIEITTKEDVPSGPPSEVVVVEGPRYVTVSWSPPKPSHRNGIITGYVIVCKANDDRLSRNFTVNATVTKVALDNLNRATSYKVGVAANTSVGAGIISHMTQISALESAKEEEPAWLKPTIIGVLGGALWVIICILIICLYRRRKAARKAKKQADNNLVTVPLQTSNNQPLFVQYQVDNASSCHRAMPRAPSTPQLARHPLMGPLMTQGSQGPSNVTSYQLEDCNMDNYNDAQNPSCFKTFYSKSDVMPTGPYATTVILSNMPSRDDKTQDSPQASLNHNNRHASSESSCTDNNGMRGAHTAGSGVDNSHSINGDSRNSPPSLPSFAEILPPPPLYPPPPCGTGKTADFVHIRSAPSMSHHALGTMPRMGTHCHTCSRSYHPSHHPVHLQRPDERAYDPNLRYGPTAPYPNNYGYQRNGGRVDQQQYQPYNALHSRGHSSDSHDYAEPLFERSDNSIYGAVPPIALQVLPPPHMLQQSLYQPHLHHQISSPYPIGKQLPQSLHRNNSAPVANHSAPSSEHSHEFCPSCAENTEYEEPWSDQPWLNMWDPHQSHHHPNQEGEQDEAELCDNCQPLMAPNEEDCSVGSSEDPSVGTGVSGQSKSGSDGSSRSGRQKRRRMRAPVPVRPASPYNGYSTDSSFVFVPRKPYPKNQRRKQMSSKTKNTKSLAVQVEQEEMMMQDRV